MGKFIDLTGKRFGRLLVISRANNTDNGKTMYLCKCDCGKLRNLYSQNLRRGTSRSCGCLTQEMHTTHNMTNTRQYKTWSSMISRCQNPNKLNYKNYGGRGITVCEKWKTFEGFWEDMQLGYSDELTIDRINNDGGYSKDNCRWATQKEQANNRSTNVYLTHNGVTKTENEWAEFLGIPNCTISLRMKRGLDINKILEKKVFQCRK